VYSYYVPPISVNKRCVYSDTNARLKAVTEIGGEMSVMEMYSFN